MSRRDPPIAIRHMLDHANDALALTRGRHRGDVEHDRTLSLAVVRALEILGEAARSVPPDVPARHPEVPWTSLVGLRNVLVHAYDTIDWDIVWEIVSADVPVLVPKLEAVLKLEER